MFLTKPKLSLIKSLFIFLLMIIVDQSCKKVDMNGMIKNDTSAVAKFLTVPANTNPTVARIINAIKNQEERYHFLNGIIANEGYAYWQNAQIMVGPASPKTGSGAPTPSPGEQVTDTIVLIPLVLANTSYVNSFISCKVDDTVTIKLHKGREYASYGFNQSPDSINADLIALTCMDLEYQTFNHHKFEIKDKRLLNFLDNGKEHGKTTITLKPSTIVPNTWITIIEAYEVEEFIQNPNDVICPPGQACQWTTTVTRYRSHTYWQEDFGDWAPGDLTEDPWSSTGGQGGGGYYLPCGSGCTPVTDSWEVVNDPTIQDFGLATFNIQEFNSNGVNNPCIKSVINDIGQGGCQSILLKMYQELYSGAKTDNYKISIVENNLLVGNTGTPVASHTDVNDLANGSKEVVISVNSTYLQNATKEFIGSVILHEFLHAFYTINSPNSTQQQQHQAVLNNGANKIKESLHELFPNLSPVDYSSLCLQGLDDVALDPVPDANGNYNYLFSQDQRALEKVGISFTDARPISLQYFNGTKGTHC